LVDQDFIRGRLRFGRLVQRLDRCLLSGAAHVVDHLVAGDAVQEGGYGQPRGLVAWASD